MAAVGDDGYPVNPDWLRLSSVGVDIGSSTSHLMLSSLVLQRQSEGLSSKFAVVGRLVHYRSPVLLTPYRDATSIDTDALSRFVDRGCAEAGARPETIDTGAVICTGVAARKQNAETITRMLSTKVGRFVAATAGPNLEAVLGAHGSGAVARSRTGRTVLNVDVGGGTSKVAVARAGAVVATAAVDVGARLVAWDDGDNVVRVEDAGWQVAERLGIELRTGTHLADADKSRLAEELASVLVEFLTGGPSSPRTEELAVTDPLPVRDPVDEIWFSGGVAEYVYERAEEDYGDLGPWLGAALRRRVPGLGIPLAASAERIRATVIGASQYTVQVSSSTVYVSSEDVLPMRDLQVVPVPLPTEPAGSDGRARRHTAEAVTAAMTRMDVGHLGLDRPFALALSGSVQPSYRAMRAVAEGIADALDGRTDQPWVVVLSLDVAGLLGAMLKADLGVAPEVVAVDGIDVGALDYIDIGEKIDAAQAIPVVVKSLVFD